MPSISHILVNPEGTCGVDISKTAERSIIVYMYIFNNIIKVVKFL